MEGDENERPKTWTRHFNMAIGLPVLFIVVPLVAGAVCNLLSRQWNWEGMNFSWWFWLFVLIAIIYLGLRENKHGRS